MRGILFKGISVKTREWVEGFYFEEAGCFIKEKPSSVSTPTHLVVPKTIGQYTGLTDKNGKRIFEGDIVAGALHWLDQKKNGVVAFREGSFGLIWYRGETDQFNAFPSMCNIEYEVIGNIHDNPELLKGGAE